MQRALKSDLPMNAIHREISSASSINAVCFCFLFSIAPHFRNMPLWVSGFVLVALGWRSLQNMGKIKEIPKWLLVPMVLFGGIGVFAEYWTIVGRDAGLALLTVMTCFKFLESRNHRDMLILIFLCYFLIATHFLFSQSILTAVLMLATLIIITSTLITLNQRDDNVSLQQRLGFSSRLVALSIPVMLVLFILVPRIPGPIWGISNEQRGGITGLSDSMSPGKISNLIRSNEVAFRVDFDGDIPAQNRLYWRGPVMSQFDGRRWYQSKRGKLGPIIPGADANPVDYTITLEPNGQPWLLALDVPTQVVRNSFLTDDYQLISPKPINDLRRYSLQSDLNLAIGIDETFEYLDRTLKYPQLSNPKTIALGESLAQQYKEPTLIVNAVLSMYREQEYVYTLQPPLLSGNVVDEFLFGSRRGFCEHYAGSFALLMRAAGIPSRIVTGYQGGEYNAVGNYLIVRQSDAHAWTEVWIENRGWVRVDPTAAVSPDRIEQGLESALSGDDNRFRFANRNPLFGNFLYSWDNLQHSWNDWVLNYNQRKQMDFLKDLNIGIENWSDMVFALVFSLLAVVGVFWAWGWYQDRPGKPPAYEREYRRLLKKLARKGISKAPAEDSRAFLRRIVGEVGNAEQLASITELYNRLKYGPDDGREGGSNGELEQSLVQLKTMVKSFQPG
jgi:transglutaminase-like putative cysteine protease